MYAKLHEFKNLKARNSCACCILIQSGTNTYIKKKFENIIIMEDFIVQKSVFHKYNYEPGGLVNYAIYNACTKK